MSQGFAAWKRVKELYGVLAVESKDELNLQNIKVKEDESRLHLNMLFWEKPLNLDIKKGKWTVLIGETGSGKSYILSQLATGLILNKEVVSMVQQEPYLFNDTIQENIFLGATPNETNLKRASDLIKIFQLDNLAPTIDEVLKLEVGENGKRLSGGQMKRVALIRSLMSGAQLIIWDDPFSSVDIILERKVVANLRQSEQWGHLTFIISSHRLTTVRLSDEVIYLDPEAGIKAQGESQKLLKDENVTKFFKEQLVDVHLA